MSDCILRLAASHSPVFLLNSCLDLFSAPPLLEDPLSRSYGVSLPSSLTVNHSSALVYSTRPPVSVYGTGRLGFRRTSRIFSEACSSATIGPPEGFPYFPASPRTFPPSGLGYTVQRAIPSARARFASPSPLVLTRAGLRNIDRMSIRLTISGRR